MESAIILVFSWLNCDDLCATRLVCRFWHDRSNDENLWTQLFHRDFAPTKTLFDYQIEYRLKLMSTVFSFGSNNRGQTGHLNRNPHYAIRLPDLYGVRQIATGQFYSAFLDDSGQVFLAGYNPLNLQRYSPGPCIKQVPNVPPIWKVICGDTYLFMIDHDGKVWVLGSNLCHEIGLPADLIYTTEPVHLEFPVRIVHISTHKERTLFLDCEERVWVCGNNMNGELGPGSVTIGPPVRLKYTNVQHINARAHRPYIIRKTRPICIRLEDDQSISVPFGDLSSFPYTHGIQTGSREGVRFVRAFGSNSHGQCGSDNYGGHFRTGNKVVGLDKPEKAVAGKEFSLVINDGIVYSFGSNNHHRAGLPNTIVQTGTPHYIPLYTKHQLGGNPLKRKVRIGYPSGRPLQIAAGRRHGLILFQKDLLIPRASPLLNQLTSISGDRYRDERGRTFRLV